MKHESHVQTFGYTDLHNHLYGCLSAESLYRIGRRNPSPRWSVFTNSYQKAYGKTIRPENFFQEYDTVEKFSQLYYFQHKGLFSEFQAKFNLIIALAEFTAHEIEEITFEIAILHSKQSVRYVEYRIMFAKDEIKPVIEEKIHAACEGARRAERQLLGTEQPIQVRIVYSLHRDGNFLEQYEWLKEFMVKDTLVKKYLVGVDFCYVEEGFPPKEKKDFFETVLRDNTANPSSALAILYHVGESYSDKTPFSASRWVLESAMYGAHRLGHCIAMGIRPIVFLNQTRRELICERLDQLEFELQYYDEIRNFGDYYSQKEIESQKKELLNLSESQREIEFYTFSFRDRDIEYLQTFQNFCMDTISKRSTVIESCPSSNYYLGMISEPLDHPLLRFVNHGLKVTIATDDPGIFNTNISTEYEKAREMALTEETLERIRLSSYEFTSEILSGRWKYS